jgi:hypothetical protein
MLDNSRLAHLARAYCESLSDYYYVRDEMTKRAMIDAQAALVQTWRAESTPTRATVTTTHSTADAHHPTNP